MEEWNSGKKKRWKEKTLIEGQNNYELEIIQLNCISFSQYSNIPTFQHSNITMYYPEEP
jgi:hypothetical protein